jgi:hypothetical protein
MKKYLPQRSKTFFKGLSVIILSCVFSLNALAQNVGINAGGAQPDAAAGLDINYTSRGLLIPRIALVSTNNFAPLSGHFNGMVVYNTSTNGDLTPGFYYNDGTKWIQGFPKPIAAGEMQYWNGTTWSTVPAGQPGQLLQINGSGVPAWTGGGFATISTTVVSGISASAASSGGNISSDGGNAVTARGVCWAITPNPTVAGSKTADGTGTGAFTSSITGLTTGTIYYLRAYATNSSGTSYGNLTVFSTP